MRHTSHGMSRYTVLKSFVSIAVLALTTASYCYSATPAGGHAATQSTTGTVTDSMCGAHHMMKNATAATCTRTCVKEGSEFALAVGTKLYTLHGDKTQLDKFAGQAATVEGTVTGMTIAVQTIRAAKAE